MCVYIVFTKSYATNGLAILNTQDLSFILTAICNGGGKAGVGGGGGGLPPTPNTPGV